MNRLLVALGAVLVVAGLVWPWLRKMHLFHLPGDIVIGGVRASLSRRPLAGDPDQTLR